MEQITVGDISVDVIRKDIKNLHLGVYPPEGKVRVASPLRISSEAIRLLVVSRIGWIKKQQQKFEAQERQGPREYIGRESHYFQGRRYLLNVIEHNAPPQVILHKKRIDLYVRPGSTQQQKEKVINQWYRDHLKAQIPALLEKWECIIGVKANDWGIKQMKTKWGACNIEAKRIWLNLELAKKPAGCLEYIIVHELIHLLERNHNERFVAYMDRYLPQWKYHKQELNRLPVSHADWSY